MHIPDQTNILKKKIGKKNWRPPLFILFNAFPNLSPSVPGAVVAGADSVEHILAVRAGVVVATKDLATGILCGEILRPEFNCTQTSPNYVTWQLKHRRAAQNKSRRGLAKGSLTATHV